MLKLILLTRTRNWEKNMQSKFKLGLLSFASLVAVQAEALAVTSDQEMAAIAKIISLSKDIPAGDATFSVVYDPSSDASKADLESLKSLIGGGYSAPKHTFKLEEVPVSGIGSIGSKIIFLTDGLSAGDQSSALNQGVANKALTVTTSLPYVENGNCVLGVDVGNNVNIIMNGEAFGKSNLDFDAAFKFMIKEL
tara:strand:+ start:10432 stop:11013 length:582 start_codon:yes stop_codon:yes gene_type:complete